MFGATERCLDSQLWHACAGALVQIPPLHSKVFYFPQGHAEHYAFGKLDFWGHHTRIPSLIPCRVSSLKYMADPDTDEVYVKLSLTPLKENEELSLEEEGDCLMGGDKKPASSSSFAKTLTQSDANNGGGFSVPRYCAETIFPRLDYSAEPPVQTIIAKDVRGQCWKFRHIYRGTPRRHLLTTGWSNFVNQKKLVAGDSIVFMRAENGDLCVGISRAKKGGIGGGEHCSGGFLCENENKFLMGRGGVVEAVTCAVNGRPFEVVYYPRAGSTPEFFVKTSVVRAAMQIQWCSGMRFKMPFETEDSSRISWFMGTVSSVQVADPIHWPDSPWRLLQVVWDEPDLLQNVKRVNPWLVEIVSNIPTFPLNQFSPPRKKPRFLEHPDFHLINQLQMSSFSGNNILNLHHANSSHCNIQDNANSSAGIQGARHAQLGLSPSDFPFNKLQSDMFLSGFQRVDCSINQPPLRPPPCGTTKKNVDQISCLLTVGNSGQNLKDTNEVKSPHILLFGQLIHTQEQSPNSFCASTNGNSSSSEEGTLQKKTSTNNAASSALHQNSPIENSSDEGSPWYKDQHKSDLGAENNVTLLCLAL